MARPARRRSDQMHEVMAGNVIARHEQHCGNAVSFPIPVEMMIEDTYGLTILWDDIPEPAGSTILGALAPAEKTIVLNARHEQLFDTYVGPLEFTLAHELAHWIYDADTPGQQQPEVGSQSEQFCYHRESKALNDTLRLRETNANKFASHLLMPSNLMAREPVDDLLDDIRSNAARLGVSTTALWYRLEGLGLVDAADAEAAGLDWV